MSIQGDKTVVITAITAATAQTVEMGGYVKWAVFKNDSPIRIRVLGHGEDTILNLWPGDVKEKWFPNHNFNTFRMYGDAVSGAVDIAAGDVLYIEYELKKHGE